MKSLPLLVRPATMPTPAKDQSGPAAAQTDQKQYVVSRSLALVKKLIIANT
jgi:hypothetical protein